MFRNIFKRSSDKKYKGSPTLSNKHSSEMSNKTMELTLNSIPEDKEDLLVGGKYILLNPSIDSIPLRHKYIYLNFGN